MNSFAALSVDSDDEDTKVNTKKTTNNAAKTAAPAKKAPAVTQRVIPGMAKPKAAAAPAPAVQELAVTDAAEVVKVNDRGGKIKERYNGHSSAKGSVPADRKAHRGRHDYDRTGRGGGKEAAKDGKGPGGWGSVEEEARRATKDAAAAEEVVAEVEEPAEVAVPEEPVPTVFSFEQAMERRNAARANQNLFGAVSERVVVADKSLKVINKEVEPETVESAAKAAKKTQRSAQKNTLIAGFTVANTPAELPRERTSAPRGARDNRSRDNGRRGPGTKLADDEFPAL